jgi:beta-hydroxylase
MSEKTHQNPSFFYDKKEFPFLLKLEDHIEIIKTELLNLIENKEEKKWLEAFPAYVKSSNRKAWSTFTLQFFQMKNELNAAICPKSFELIQSIPEVITSEFSFLKPKSKILAHKGFSKMILRAHLPLIVPKGDTCAIRVGDETHFWKEGELVIFDDSFDHEAWNNSDDFRVILMIDIPNPRWNYSANEISKYKIEHLEDSFLLSIASKEQWLKSYQDRRLPLVEFD